MYFVYDGHGSVRALTDTTGTVTDTYDYDAFGNLIHSTGTSYNNYLFAGEQFDPDLNLYFNRARYLNVSTGRFWTIDSKEGRDDEPLSLHKFLYAENEPVNRIDPSGNATILEEEEKEAIAETIDVAPVLQGAAILLLFVAEFSGGINEHPKVSPTPDANPDTTRDDPRLPNRMRVQLQEGLETTFYGVAQQNTAQIGVTVYQMQSALQTLYNMASNDATFGRSSFPFNALNDWLVSSIIIASEKLKGYPPGGIALPRRNFLNIPTIQYRRKEYRLDVDNLVGHNLRQ
jgi:RHS repeat-associated protein